MSSSLDTMNQIVGLAQAEFMNYPPGMLNRLKLAGSIALMSIPDSLKRTREGMKEKKQEHSLLMRARKYGLATATAAQLYLDDSIFLTTYTATQDVRGGIAAPWLVTGAAATLFQAGLARLDQKYVAPELAAEAYTKPKSHENQEPGLMGKIKNKFNRAQYHAGRLATSLFVLGVPAHASVSPMTKKEVYTHAAVWGATAPAYYEAVNFGLGPLDSSFAPYAAAGVMIVGRYVNNMWERAGERLQEQPVQEDARILQFPNLVRITGSSVAES